MDETRATVKLLSARNGRAPPVGEVQALVDTGATLSVLPARLLRAAGVAIEDRVTLVLANGKRVKRKIGNATYLLQGVRIATPVIFGARGDPPLVGLVSLESARYTVDPMRRRLVRVRAVHQH